MITRKSLADQRQNSSSPWPTHPKNKRIHARELPTPSLSSWTILFEAWSKSIAKVLWDHCRLGNVVSVSTWLESNGFTVFKFWTPFLLVHMRPQSSQNRLTIKCKKNIAIHTNFRGSQKGHETRKILPSSLLLRTWSVRVEAAHTQ